MKEHASNRKLHAKDHRLRTDWARVDALTDEEIDAAIRDDPDAAPELDEEWFATATLILPQEQVSLRLDRDVLEHFRRYPRYQTRINAILRAVMEHEKKAAPQPDPAPDAGEGRAEEG